MQNSRCSAARLGQVTGASVEGDMVKLTVEPAKGGEPQTLEANVVLVSAGAGPCSCESAGAASACLPCRQPHAWRALHRAAAVLRRAGPGECGCGAGQARPHQGGPQVCHLRADWQHLRHRRRHRRSHAGAQGGTGRLPQQRAAACVPGLPGLIRCRACAAGPGSGAFMRLRLGRRRRTAWRAWRTWRARRGT